MSSSATQKLNTIEIALSKEMVDASIEMDILRRRNSELQAVNADLCQKNAELHKTVSGGWELKAELERLRFVEEDMQLTREELVLQIVNLKESSENSQNEINKFKQQIDELKNNLAAKKNECIELVDANRKLQKISSEVAAIKASSEADKLQIKQLSNDNRLLHEALKSEQENSLNLQQKLQSHEASLRNAGDKITYLTHRKDKEVEDIKKQLRISEQGNHSLKDLTQKLEKSVTETAQNSLHMLESKMQIHAEENMHLKELVKDLTSKNSDLMIMVNELSLKNSDLGHLFSALNEKENELRSRSLQQENRENSLNEQMDSLAVKHEDLKQVVKDKISQVEDLQNREKHLIEQLTNLKSDTQVLVVKYKKLKQVTEDKTNQVELLQKREKYLMEQAASLKLDLQILMTRNAEISVLQSKLHTLEATIQTQNQNFSSEVSTFQDRTQYLSKMIEVYLQQINDLNDKLQTKTSATLNLQEEMSRLITVVDRKDSEMTELVRSLEVERNHSSSLGAMLKDQTAGLNSIALEKKEIEKQHSALKNREEQLRQFVVSISKEKANIGNRYKQLANEIRSASTLHPLRDYLSLTEHELSKVEIQMKKTPTLSIDRARLEDCFTKLIEQRDFLNAVIQKSEALLEKQANALLNIPQSEIMAAIPPLPPLL